MALCCSMLWNQWALAFCIVPFGISPPHNGPIMPLIIVSAPRSVRIRRRRRRRRRVWRDA